VNVELVVERIRFSRLYLGLTQREFAELAGVGLRSLEAWESGARPPSLKNLRRIASATNRPVSWFLGLDETAVVEERVVA